ncbi:hypothetical protein PRIPAC_86249 [Pristionchus pacificus]|uniref:Uncharacterized protein n=1 Tax=Pristionchus pacificus TaxID=54126 RepID=A0A2A6BGN3_PRIPA|nr:hypothetical protein PRIPAC_86249 [Pristionchus pacificus]|eukprot:PDM65054.1 hypothetical protein PRIPAC_53303 [Pristionchus pacificus]
MGTAGEQFDFAKIVSASDTYDDAHRGLLKILIDRGSLTERAFCAHYVRCFATLHFLDEIDYDANELHLKGVTPEAVAELRKKLLETMNTKVQHIGLRLMNAHDEAKNKKKIVLVSERHYSPALAGASPFELVLFNQTNYSNQNELFLVVSWLETMLKPDNDGYIPTNDALKSARDLPVPMKMEKAQQLIDQLLKDDWMRVEAGDMLTLTTRALTELGPILRSRFHCATCCLCTNVTIRKASMLSCDKCECIMHVSCWNNLANNSKSEKVRCPGNGCKAMLKKEEMTEQIKEIEEARNSHGKDRRSRHSTESDPSTSKKSSRGRKNKKATMESDEDEDTGRMRTLRDEDGSKKSSRRGKKTSKKATMDSDSDGDTGRAMSMGSDSDGEAGDLVTANSDGMTGDVSTAKSINGMSDNDDEEVFTKSTRKQFRRSDGSAQSQARKKSKEDDGDEEM